uniref:PNPLA domain-containing protein n=1 Tax=Peronospora matthiolae TaxID=2874970 RepID=A0AAV1VJ44_9STRA
MDHQAVARFTRMRRRCLGRRVSTAASPTAHNFSFSGCGFLIPYHLGVAQELQDAGYIQSRSRFAGASGGAIAALALAANVSMDDIHEETKAMARLCRSHGTFWKLEDRLRTVFHAKFGDLPVESLTHSRLTIATKKMWPRHATCLGTWARRGTTLFRGEYQVDGGLITLVPEVQNYTKVCVFPGTIMRRKDYDISPSIDPDFPFSFLELLRFALFPPETDVLDQLFDLGRHRRGFGQRSKQRKWKDVLM